MADLDQRGLIARARDRYSGRLPTDNDPGNARIRAYARTTALSATTKGALVVWGLANFYQGIILDMEGAEHAPFAFLEEKFIYLVYFSVLFVGSFSFLSTRVTSLALAVIAIIAFGIVFSTTGSANGLGLYDSTAQLSLAILLRPAGAAIILFIVSHFERRRSL